MLRAGLWNGPPGSRSEVRITELRAISTMLALRERLPPRSKAWLRCSLSSPSQKAFEAQRLRVSDVPNPTPNGLCCCAPGVPGAKVAGDI